MAKKNNNEIIVGITVVGVLALALYIIVLLADFGRFTTDYQRITFKLPYRTGLQGLSSGSPVKLGGYKVGQVVTTRITSPESPDSDDIFVTFTIELPEHYRLHQDCTFVPEVGLLGNKAELNIVDLGSSDSILKDGGVYNIQFGDSLLNALKKEIDLNNSDSILFAIKSELNRTNEDSLLGALASSARKLNSITGSLEHEFETDLNSEATIIKEFKSAVVNLNQISETAKSQMDIENSQAIISKIKTAIYKLDDSMGDLKGILSENKANISETITSLKNTAGQLEKDLPTLTGKIDQILDKASGGLDTAQEALSEFKKISESANNILEVNRDKIDLLIDNVAIVSSNLKLVSQEIRRAPWRLLYKPDKKEIDIQSTVDSAAAFAIGAERLDNAANSLKKVVGQLGSGVAVGSDKVNQIIAELENSFEQFHKAEEKLWDELK